MRILVVGPSWVGDMVMAQTLFKLLKHQNAECCIDVLAPAWSRPLLARMPEVNQALTMPLGHGAFNLKTRYQLAKSLRANDYQQAIVLPNSWKSALVPWFAKIPLRTGWVGEQRWGLLNDPRRLDKQKLPLMIQRFCALGLAANQNLPEQLPSPELKLNQDDINLALEQHHLNCNKPILALCPGAEYGPAKRWPATHFADTAKQKIKQGWQVWIFGSDKDTPIAQEIQQYSQDQCLDLTGKTSLAEAIDLISLASCVVSNDSGLMHIASAVKRATVAVYGSSSSQFTPPLHQDVKMLSLNLDCSPCFKRSCPLGHTNCLYNLKPQTVLRAVEELAS